MIQKVQHAGKSERTISERWRAKRKRKEHKFAPNRLALAFPAKRNVLDTIRHARMTKTSAVDE